MSWQLTLITPDSVTHVYEWTSPNPIIGGVTAIVDPHGATKQIIFRARQDLLQAPPRGYVFFRAPPDGTLVAAGVIVTCPPLTSPGAGPADTDDDALERITAIGLEQLVRDSVIGPRLFEEDTDVATIAFELCDLYAHPDLLVDVENFPATGHVLNLFYRPESTLAEALDALIETLPGEGRWYVDALAQIRFVYTPPPEPEE